MNTYLTTDGRKIVAKALTAARIVARDIGGRLAESEHEVKVAREIWNRRLGAFHQGQEAADAGKTR